MSWRWAWHRPCDSEKPKDPNQQANASGVTKRWATPFAGVMPGAVTNGKRTTNLTVEKSEEVLKNFSKVLDRYSDSSKNRFLTMYSRYTNP